MHVFGLTGGFASGKSTVVARLRARGVPVVEADELAREIVEPGSEGLSAVIDAFGPEMLGPGGRLDRKRLGELVFSDPAARARLEAILHPRIRARMHEKTRAFGESGEPLVCYEAPLLVEVGLAGELRPLVVVAADEATQIRRATARDGSTPEAARARLRAQLPLADKVALADHVIDNSGPLEQTLEATDRVLEAVCREVGVPLERYSTG